MSDSTYSPSARMVKTGKDSVEVHVGPTAYLAEKGITLAKGDTLEILGI